MAVDKLVDSTQLDSDLTSVANAIRAKSGGSGQLAFPSGFVSEIGNIPSGGGIDFFDLLHEYEVTVASDGLTFSVSDAYNYIPQFVAFVAETPYIIPPSGSDSNVLSGACFKPNARSTITGDTGSVIACNGVKSNGVIDYWNSWGKAVMSTTGVTVTITRSGLSFYAGQKYKVIVLETTDYLR